MTYNNGILTIGIHIHYWFIGFFPFKAREKTEESIQEYLDSSPNEGQNYFLISTDN
jgi:hypothetical protein